MKQIPSRTLERRTPVGKAAGIMDTIADAITLVAQRPWLMIVPMVVDLILLLFLRVTTGPLQQRLIQMLETSRIEGSEQVIEQIRATGDQVMISDYLGAFVPTLLTGISLDSILGILMLVVAPDGFGIPRSHIYAPWAKGISPTIDPQSALTVGIIWLVVLVVSSFALVLFRVPIVRIVRGSSSTGVFREMCASWWHFVVYLIMVGLLLGAALIPFTILALLATVLGLGVLFVGMVALLVFGGMISMYTFFTVDAMLIHRTSAINGFRMSYAVGRVYFGEISRYALTSVFLMLASLRLWSEIANSAPGFIIALIGSAFIGTALAVANVLFYTDRYRLVRAIQTSQRSGPERRSLD